MPMGNSHARIVPAGLHLWLCLCLGLSEPAMAEAAFPPYPDAPTLQARSAILMDAATGDVLFELSPGLEIPPASLTKLMTIHLAYKAIQEGRFSLDSPIPIHAEDCYPDLPYRSSLLFLGPGMRVSLGELLLGMAVPSGNDAAFAVARALSGSIEDFAREMNREARAMGLTLTRFTEPSGLSEHNMTTAAEFAVFCRQYILLHPQALADLHSVRSLAFPLLRNMPEGFSGQVRPVVQDNRNLLLWDYPGCDGLKTGYIDESGYNIALTAMRDGTRLIAVILGGYGASTAEGSRTRADNGSRLLDYGFSHFKTLRPKVVSLEPIRLYKGRADQVRLEPGAELVLTARQEDLASMSVRVERDRWALAPLAKGSQVGEIIVSADGRLVKRFPLVTAEEAVKGNPLKCLWHSIILIFKGKARRS